MDHNENFLEEISGLITSGSINVDGDSSVRRSCSLSFVIDDSSSFNSSLWIFKNRFQLFVGLENNISNDYEKIIWFKQGVFILTSFSKTINLNSITLNISGKDKGCLLNGEVGGTIVSTTNFDSTDIYSSETEFETVKNPIPNIIKYAVHTFGNEPYENIYINDLDFKGVELLEYTISDIEMYILQDVQTLKFQIVFEGIGSLGEYLQENDLDEGDSIIGTDFVIFRKITDGDTPGYRPTELIYPDELVSSPGGNVATSVLDPIVNQLGNYEYYYDIDGKFIFQEKKNYVQTNWDNIQSIGGIAFINENINSFYDFFTDEVVQSYSVTSSIEQMKNDFVCWGEKTGESGAKINICLRVALDIKPKKYISYDQKEFIVSDKCDYREIIYQMALDHSLNENKDDFIFKAKIFDENDQPIDIYHYVTYYPEMLAFWREIYSENNEWIIDANKEPEKLTFWLEFLNIDGNYEQLSTIAIGRRISTKTESSAKAINYRETPDIIFDIGSEMTNEEKVEYSGYTIIQIPVNYTDYFKLSSKGKNCKDVIDSMIYNNLVLQQTISCSCIPVYCLEPNTLISLSSNYEEISNNYIIKSFSLNFNNNSLMTLSLVKLIDEFY